MFDGEGIRSKQAPSHPVVEEGCDRVRGVVGLAVADDAGVCVDAQQQQAGHDMVWNDSFEGSDANAAAVGNGRGFWGDSHGGRGCGKQGITPQVNGLLKIYPQMPQI